MQWRQLAANPDHVARLEQGWPAHLDELVSLEGDWQEAAAGGSLLHFDLRADNVLLADDGVWVVDWPWAAIGAAWVDLAAMLPSVHMQGGPPPDELWRDHTSSTGVDDEALDAFLAGLAGFFTHQSLLPPPPGLPTVRAFQAGQAVTARAWLARRRRWAGLS